MANRAEEMHEVNPMNEMRGSLRRDDHLGKAIESN
jgi:hypothetical protein